MFMSKLVEMWLFSIAESSLPGYSICVNGTIQLSIEKCCPLFFVGHHLKGIPLKDGCLDITHRDLIQVLPLLYDRLHMLDWQYKRQPHRINCEKHKGDANYTCFIHDQCGTIAQSIIGKVFIMYPCFQRQDIDILINITLEGKNNSHPETKCLPVYDDSCAKYYNYSSLPSMTGHTRRNPAINIKGTLQQIINLNCHKYAYQFLCHAFLPQCQNDERILPCKSTCLEIFHACSKFVFQNNVTDSILNIPQFGQLYYNMERLFIFFCNELPESDCYKTEPITCQPPENIEHGINNSTQNIYPVKSTVGYRCQSGYKLDGNGTVTCEYTGKWSEIPKCLVKNSIQNLIIICSVFGAFLLLLIVAVLFTWKYRLEISAILYAKYGIKFTKEKEEKRENDIYIAYTQHDFGFVKTKLLDPMEKLGIKVCIPERDFRPGDFKSLNIVKKVQASKRTIIVLSQYFIDSGWCQFEFAQAHLNTLTDESFKLILITIEEPKTLQNIPRIIREYINSRTYLMKDDRLFWEKLLYQMPKINHPIEQDRCHSSF